MDRIFVDLQMVGDGDQRLELQTQFVLGRGHLVMVLLDLGAHGRHGREHFAAHVLRRVDRRDREIAALGAHAVAEVAALIGRAGVRRQFAVSRA